jgi:hypothetical protein
VQKWIHGSQTNHCDMADEQSYEFNFSYLRTIQIFFGCDDKRHKFIAQFRSQLLHTHADGNGLEL